MADISVVGPADGEPAVMLNTFTPDLYVQYFRDMRDATAGGGPPTAQLITELMARYGTAPAGVLGG